MKKFFIAIALIFLPILALAQNNSKKIAYFFYLPTCPHCHNVDKYFSENGIYDRFDIKKLDASVPANGKFLMDLYELNKVPEEQRGGVPVVAFADKFFVGDKPVEDNFLKEIELAENTSQSPVAPTDVVVNEGPIARAQADSSPSETNPSVGKKKDYSSVIILAFILAVGGALVYLNRK